MSDHLPWINHLAAREAGVTLIEFFRLTTAERAEWRRFVLEGPSRFLETMMIARCENMIADYLTGAKKMSPVDAEWLDGVLEHPKAAWDRRVEEAKRSRRAARIAAARALYERERGK